MVHNDSIGKGADADWSRIPLTDEMGERDQEGEAQRLSERTLTPFDIEMTSSSEEENIVDNRRLIKNKAYKNTGGGGRIR